MTAITAGRSTNAPWVGTCPDGCDGQHLRDVEGNFFHRTPVVTAAPPQAAVGRTYKSGEPEAPCLTAHLVVPDGPELAEEAPHIAIDGGDLFGPYAELDADEAGEFITSLKTLTAAVEQMRDQLTKIKEQQS
ncbi:hypothetical protein [Streptomyces sp. NPDC006552]|uniref:DUF6907 domain-containing protein n=1 Tax=Streptomyces sp. NPDC006552 TaxID=3157179 RepID=UPI0033B0575F